MGRRRAAALALGAGALLLVLAVFDAMRPVTVELAAPLAAVSIPGRQSIAVVRSEATARCLGDPPGYAEHAAYWLALLRGAGYATAELGDAQLASNLGGHAAVILPAVACVGDEARAALNAFVRRGGGIVATWAFGTNGSHGEWRGFDLLAAWTGALRFGHAREPAPFFVSVTSVSPLGAGSAGAGRVQVTSAERVEATARDVDAYWSDARLFPREPSLPPNDQAAALHREVDAGRVVWLGFHENSAAAGGPDAARLDAVLVNAVAWASRRPLVALEPWPAPHGSAALLAVNVDEHPDQARLLAQSLAQRRAPATFFLDPAQVTDRELLAELASTGELALAWSPRTAPSLASQTLERLRWESARLGLWWRSSIWAQGARPAGDVWAGAASEMLARAGARYHLAAGGVDSVLPTLGVVRRAPFALSGEDSMVGLLRNADDDLHLSPLGLTGLSPDWIAQRILADADIVERIGGLYVLSLHTQGLGQTEYLPALRAAVDGLVGRRAWIARASDLARWWADRGRVRLALSAPSGATLRVDVASTARRPLDRLALVVHAGSPLRSARIVGPTPAALHTVVARGEGRVRLTLPRLAPRRTLSIELTFDR